MAEYVSVAQLKDVPPGSLRLVQVGAKRIALANVGGSVYAFDEVCTHRQGPLSRGTLTGDVVTCPWHGSKFNVKTGAVVGPPATTALKVYQVQVEGQQIRVAKPD